MGHLSLPTFQPWRRLGLALFVLCLIAGRPFASQADPSANILVTTTEDEWDSGDDCSLREAVWAANTDLPFGGCPAGSGSDVIELPAGTYTLTQTGPGGSGGDLDLASPITINGAGQATTIVEGNGLHRVFSVLGASAALNDLTITGGRAPHGTLGEDAAVPGNDGGNGANGVDGGGIRNEASLLMNRCTIRDNRAGNGGSGGDGAAGISGVAPGDPGMDGGDGGLGGYGGNGGGIYSVGPLTLNDCTLEDNRAGVGGEGGWGGNGSLAVGGTPGGQGGAGGTGRRGGEGGDGGAIYSEDTLELNNCILRDNRAGDAGPGGRGGKGGNGGLGYGGPIASSGGDGGAGGDGGEGSEGGDGGAIYTHTPLTVWNSLITLNRSGQGGRGAIGGAGGSGGDGGNGVGFGCVGGRGGAGAIGGPGGDGGNGGDGGGIAGTGTFSMTSSQVSLNRSGDGGSGATGGQGGDGGAGGDGLSGTAGSGGNGGAGGLGGFGGHPGDGGGIRGSSAAGDSFALTDSTVSGNQTGQGADGGQGGRGGDGGEWGRLLASPGINGTGGRGGEGTRGGNGGGLIVAGGGPRALIKACTINDNVTGSGGQGGAGGNSGAGASATGDGGAGGHGGAGGYGGGLCLVSGHHSLLNSTVSGNQTGNGAGGGAGGNGTMNDGPGGHGGYAGAGGGIFGLAVVGATSCTVAENQANGTGGLGGQGSPAGTAGLGGRGGGIRDVATFTMTHTILGDNAAVETGADCHGVLDSEGYNLVESLLGCTLNDPDHDITGVDPDLVALADNGGETETHALQSGSPALDGGSATCYDHLGAPLTVDQRGSPRPVDGDGVGGAQCDIGAFEFDRVRVYLPVVRKE